MANIWCGRLKQFRDQFHRQSNTEKPVSYNFYFISPRPERVWRLTCAFFSPGQSLRDYFDYQDLLYGWHKRKRSTILKKTLESGHHNYNFTVMYSTSSFCSSSSFTSQQDISYTTVQLTLIFLNKLFNSLIFFPSPFLVFFFKWSFF